MEESGEGEESIEGEQRPFLVKEVPNIKVHQLEIQQLTNLIHEKESYLRSLSRKSTVPPEEKRETLVAKLEWFKNLIEEKQKAKQSIEKSLKEVNQQLQKKAETCGKFQVTLRYKDEQRTNDAIKRLENHLCTHQLKISEEKKLISEINSLKRSKRNLSAFLSAKQEVDHLRLHQGQMRAQRDHLLREIGDLKGKENTVKISLESTPENTEDTIEKENKHVDPQELKKEIDELYKQRRECQVTFKKDMIHYEREQKTKKHEMIEQQKREEIRLKRFNNTVVNNFSYSSEESQPVEEQMICDSLIKFLFPFKLEDGRENSNRVQPCGETSHNTPDNSNEVLLVRNNEEEMQGIFASSKQKPGGKKRNKKARKTKYSSQKLVLHPDVLGKFLKLNILPPSTYADVNTTIEQLLHKKEFFHQEVTIETMVQPMDPTIADVTPATDIETPNNGRDSSPEESMVAIEITEENPGLLVPKDSVVTETVDSEESPSELPRNIGDHTCMKDLNDNDCSNEAIKCWKLPEEQSENKTIFEEKSHGDSLRENITNACLPETDLISETLEKVSVGHI